MTASGARAPLGGTTPLMGAWLLSRTGAPLAPDPFRTTLPLATGTSSISTV